MRTVLTIRQTCTIIVFCIYKLSTKGKGRGSAGVRSEILGRGAGWVVWEGGAGVDGAVLA